VNLAILIGRFPPGPIGGAEIQAEGWAQLLADRHRVTVITRRDSAPQPRNRARDGFDVVIGHTRKVFVGPGDRVRRGALFARVSDSGAPDGCHLHFEVRRPGGGVSAAVDPATLLALRP